MEKVQAAVLLLGLLLLTAAHQDADAQGWSIPSMPLSLGSNKAVVSCKALGNCEKKNADRAPDQANKYTRGCSKINQCRG